MLQLFCMSQMPFCASYDTAAKRQQASYMYVYSEDMQNYETAW